MPGFSLEDLPVALGSLPGSRGEFRIVETEPEKDKKSKEFLPPVKDAPVPGGLAGGMGLPAMRPGRFRSRNTYSLDRGRSAEFPRTVGLRGTFRVSGPEGEPGGTRTPVASAKEGLDGARPSRERETKTYGARPFICLLGGARSVVPAGGAAVPQRRAMAVSEK